MRNCPAQKTAEEREICLIQPPLVQLNGPYPAPYYLKTFLEKRGYPVTVRDHSIALFERIFCRGGIEKIFSDLSGRNIPDGASGGDKRTQYYIERFLSEKELWVSSVDGLVNFLRGRDREWGHLLALANGTVPGGPRFDAFLEQAGGQVSPETAPLLASKILADLADFITLIMDPSFALVRYVPRLGESPGTGFRNFGELRKNLGGYIMEAFYRPFLEEEWNCLNPPFIMGITIPFPGCLAGALICAASAKARFGQDLVVAAGGGYVNTELRFMSDPGFFDFVDYLSFDRGYGSWEAILEHRNRRDPSQEPPVLYRTMYYDRKKNAIIRDPAIAGEPEAGDEREAQGRAVDREAVKNVFPNYSGVDFSRYLCPVDDANPMHRLWSDGRWLKAYLAQGCYWHGCTFCDTTLDYIRSYEPVDTEALFRHLQTQTQGTGIRGVHLVDEAAPPVSILRLAELNREAGLRGEKLPLVLWGNIRFDPRFGPDEAALLAAGGLMGVSAGIEVATEPGFKRLHKGIGLGDVVRVCAAFKEAGVLTHGYLIYGYWDGDDQEIVDSAEIVRQLFVNGLLDSAFWHKFVLTRHSRLYDEWRRGLHGDLVLPEPGAAAGNLCFACNDLSFKGEKKFDKFTPGLDRLLSLWMAGDTSEPVTRAFSFKVPSPSVSPGTVALLLDSYARDRDKDRAALPGSGRLLFLGSRPVLRSGSREAVLFWRWRLEDRRLKLKTGSGGEAALRETAALLEKASRSPGLDAGEFRRALEGLRGEAALRRIWKTLRQGGLITRP